MSRLAIPISLGQRYVKEAKKRSERTLGWGDQKQALTARMSLLLGMCI